MNLSDNFILKILNKFNMNLEDPKIFIFCDSLEIPFGKWKFKSKGSH